MFEASESIIPQSIISKLAGDPEAVLIQVSAEQITSSSGAATGQVVRFIGEFRHQDGRIDAFKLIRKSLRPLDSGRHAAFANAPGHWAYWRRELLAYSSDILPAGSGLVAPRCFGINENDLYLEDITGQKEVIDRAAKHLADWQSRTIIPNLPWLTQDQLGQRIQVSNLDWHKVEVDQRVVTLWNRRDKLLRRLAKLPRVISHGDYSLGNLIARGHETVALDWGTLGIAPVGSDLAHLALSALADPTSYFLESAQGHWPTQDVLTGFQVTLALVGSSRTHWMLSRRVPIPEWYIDFLWDNQPD